MSDHDGDPYGQAREALACWHATHPVSTLAEIEEAVEEQIRHLRAQLVQERTAEKAGEEHPVCRACGATMEPRGKKTRTVVLPGDEPLLVERTYVVCPHCGAGLFPPG